MLISAKELKKYITVTDSDEILTAKLNALEILIRRYTNNNFQNRNKRFRTSIVNGKFQVTYPYILKGDTIEISQSKLNDGIYTFDENMDLFDEDLCLVTKVEYPFDVIMGCINMLKWDLNNRDKIGVQSETLSRHSVTYFNMDGENSLIGYPKSLIGFLKPYMKARF